MTNMKKQILLAVLAFATTTIVLAQCYIDQDSVCPGSVSADGLTCALSSGSNIPFIAAGQPGFNNYSPDGDAWCTYHCSDGTNHSYYPGARTTGEGC
jgi:hypothetical protein